MKKAILTLVSLIWLTSISFAWPLIEINRNYDFPYEEERADSMKDILKHSDVDDLANAYLWNNEVQTQRSPISYYISKVINYFLVILAFISFLVLLYWFSLVFTDKTDEWLKKWYKYIKMAAIAIIVIWISWLFSMWIFSIYNNDVLK